jgi:hypothetical protein
MLMARHALALLIMLLGACGASDMEHYDIPGRYALDLPSYLTVSSELNEHATFQAASTENDCYLIILDEEIESFESTVKLFGMYDSSRSITENYFEAQSLLIGENIRIAKQEQLKSRRNEQLQFDIWSIEGYLEELDKPLYYEIAVTEHQDRLYMLMFWTYATYEDRYRKDIGRILDSWRIAEEPS